jgi:hypothetical protein
MPKADLNILDFPSIPEGVTPIEGVLVMKCMDSEGHTTFYMRYTTGIQIPEALGMCSMAVELMKAEVRDYFVPMSDEDREDGPDES